MQQGLVCGGAAAPAMAVQPNPGTAGSVGYHCIIFWVEFNKLLEGTW